MSFVPDRRILAELFRERLMMVINKNGMSLGEFSKAVGIDRSALSQFMAPNATRLPRAETLCAISKACGISLDWLLGIIASDELHDDRDSVPLIQIETFKTIVDDTRLLEAWHKEAIGYKIRYVPSTLPDLLRSKEISQYEFVGYGKNSIQIKDQQADEQLNYSRRLETDIEVCLPIQTIRQFARAEGLWEFVPVDIRIAQLKLMISLLNELYPRFRLFLYDQREMFSAPYTIFGIGRAVLYLGHMYVVINSVDHIQSLIQHFDNMIRIAKIGPDAAADEVAKCLKWLEH